MISSTRNLTPAKHPPVIRNVFQVYDAKVGMDRTSFTPFFLSNKIDDGRYERHRKIYNKNATTLRIITGNNVMKNCCYEYFIFLYFIYDNNLKDHTKYICHI